MVAGPLVCLSLWLSDFHEETAEGNFLVALPGSHPDQQYPFLKRVCILCQVHTMNVEYMQSLLNHRKYAGFGDYQPIINISEKYNVVSALSVYSVADKILTFFNLHWIIPGPHIPRQYGVWLKWITPNEAVSLGYCHTGSWWEKGCLHRI